MVVEAATEVELKPVGGSVAAKLLGIAEPREYDANAEESENEVCTRISGFIFGLYASRQCVRLLALWRDDLEEHACLP